MSPFVLQTEEEKKNTGNIQENFRGININFVFCFIIIILK